MKRIQKRFIMAVTVVSLISLAGCGISSVIDKDAQTNSEQNTNNPEEKPTSKKLASTIPLTYDFGHSKETVDGKLWFGQKDYYIYLPDTVQAKHAENGNDLIATIEIPTSTMTIRSIGNEDLQASIKKLKEELASSYPNQPILENEKVPKLNGKLLHHMVATDNQTTTKAFFLKIEGKQFLITQHMWNSELFEEVRFTEMINSLGTISDDVAK